MHAKNRFDPFVFEEILEYLEQGVSLHEVCAMPGMPSVYVVRQWRSEEPAVDVAVRFYSERRFHGVSPDVERVLRELCEREWKVVEAARVLWERDVLEQAREWRRQQHCGEISKSERQPKRPVFVAPKIMLPTLAVIKDMLAGKEVEASVEYVRERVAASAAASRPEMDDDVATELRPPRPSEVQHLSDDEAF